MKILILGISGLIGSAMYRVLSENSDWQVFGTSRSSHVNQFFHREISDKIYFNVGVDKINLLEDLLLSLNPDVVINCIGLTKHQPDADNKLMAISINALFPHQLSKLCILTKSRLIHISTDCVFSGSKGSYVESDESDAIDIYGKVKYLGEISDLNSLTLRTSTIGHELETQHGLLEWFLSQTDRCNGFRNAIFSGLPNIVFAQVVRDLVIPRPEMSGLYHVGADPINKYDLLRMIADVYGKSIDIIPNESFSIDRSLNSDKFRSETGFLPPKWPKLIETMYNYQNQIF